MNNIFFSKTTILSCVPKIEEIAGFFGIGCDLLFIIFYSAAVFVLILLLINLSVAAFIMLSGFSMKARKKFIGNRNYDTAVLDKNVKDLMILLGNTTSEKNDTHEVTEHYSFETDGNGRVTKVTLGNDFHETIALFYVAIYITLMCQVPYLLTKQGFTVNPTEDGSYLCLREDIALKISGENGLVTFIELSRCEGR